MTSVVLVDDQEMIRVGLRVMLEARGVTVLDGITATSRIVEEGLPTSVLVLTTYDLDDMVYGALRSGAAGFLLKSEPAARLVERVNVVAAGEALLSPTVTRRLIERHLEGPDPRRVEQELAGLTDREREVLVQVARGLTNEEIAASLLVSQATVKSHVNRLFAKLSLTSRVQAVVLAHECGLVVPGRHS